MKTINPFKMIGSWIGAVIPYSIHVLYSVYTVPVSCNIGQVCNSSIIYVIKNSFHGSSGGLLLPGTFPPIILVPLGFFLGYGAQLLIRRLRK